MKKKVFSLVLVLCMMMSLLPTVASATVLHTQAEAVAWANSQIGVALDYDGIFGAQCVDLIAYYYVYLGQSAPGGDAYQYASGGNYTPQGWSYQSSPQPGDIAVDGNHSETYPGHVGIVVAVNGNNFTCIEQNYAGVQYCRSINRLISAYEYTTFIRPDFTPAPVAPNAPSVTVSGKTVDVTWNDVGASSYYLYVENRATGAQPFSQNLGKTFSCHLELGAANWRVYVSAVYADGTTKSSSTDFTIQPDYKAPTVSASVNGKTVDISWNDVGAVSYELHVFNKNTGAVAYSNDMGDALSAHLELSGGTWQANVTAMFDGMDGGMAGSCEFTILSSYTVSYDANGGTGAPASQTKTQGTALALSNDKPTRADAPNGSYTVTLNANGGAVNQTSFTANSIIRYAFTNWNTASNGSGTSYAAGASYTADDNATLYAQWESTAITDTIHLPTPSRDGFSFLGWAESADAVTGITGVYTPNVTITLYATWGIPIDETHFPDANFRSLVAASFDQNSDGYLVAAELAAVTSIDCNWKEISSLRGVEYFTELRRLECSMNALVELDLRRNSKIEHLSCNGNDLTTLDLSGNAALQELHCNFNELTSLTLNASCPLRILQCMNNQLSSLNVETFALLTELACGYNQLTALDISGNGNLEHLNCDNNNLSALDVTHNPNLIGLACSDNSISSLNVSCNPRLEILTCAHNALRALDISNNAELTQLVCDGNVLGALDTRHNTKLEHLQCAGVGVTQLDLSNNPALKVLDCAYNYALMHLDIRQNTQLERLRCEGTSIDRLIISLCPKLVFLVSNTERQEQSGYYYYSYYTDNVAYRLSYDQSVTLIADVGGDPQGDGVPIDEEHFPDANFRSYVEENFDLNLNGQLSTSEIDLITEIRCLNQNIQTLKGIEYLTSLLTLYCSGNAISSLDLSQNVQLQALWCNDNPLGTIDISQNAALEILQCTNTQLASLDVSHNTLLVDLECGGNLLTSLDVSNNPALRALVCDNNRLTSLAVSANTKLESLWCSKNLLTSLDVSSNPKLIVLFCSDNSLSAIDTSHNPELTYLGCHSNQLTELNVSANPLLATLYTHKNKLSELDISMCPRLLSFVTDDNRRELEDQILYPWEDASAGGFSCDYTVTLITGNEPLVGIVNVYYYYSDKGFEFGYAGADTIGSEQTETAPEKDGYTFLGWYQVTEKDENGLAKAYGEKLSSSLNYSYALEEVVSIAAVYEVVAAHSHVWDDGVTTTPATCDVDGVMTYTCSVCGETKTEPIPAGGHKWDAGTVTTAATCTEAGVMTYTCTACGITGTTEIPALGHHYEGGVCITCGEVQSGFAPRIVEGSGGTAHYGSDYSFRSDAAFDTFLAVYVDSAELSPANYTAKEGSTIVTLKGSYIKTLAAGTHTIRIASTLGNADGTFKVSESPKTGDTSDLFKWSFLAVDSFVCLVCLWGLYLLASKKRRAYDPRH